MCNQELLKQMLIEAAENPHTTREELQTALLTSIAGSLAVIADSVKEEGADDAEEDQDSRQGT